MPTYEYICSSCGPFDLFQSMSDAPLSACPTCGASVKRKINGGMGVIFKGSGFYKNDSRKDASSKPKDASSKPNAAPSDSSADSSAKSEPGCESCAAAPKCDSPAKDSV
jgi:putative FmdB family regulatory protein